MVFGSPVNFRAPDSADCGGYTFRMLVPGDAAADYAAVMGSKDRIRGVFGNDNDWPPDGLTYAENAADLERHEKESRSNVSFAYSVWRGDSYVACLYIKPFKTKREQDARRGKFKELCYVWIAEGFVAEEPQIYAASREWLVQCFPLMAPVWPGREVSWAQWEAMSKSY